METPKQRKRETPEERRIKRQEKKEREERRRAKTLEDHWESLNRLIEMAESSGRPNFTAILNAQKIIMQSQGLLIDVQKVEVSVEKSPEEFEAIGRDAIHNDPMMRERFRRWIAEADALGDGLVGDRSQDSPLRLLSPPPPSGFFS